jgi:hypothetical protein
MVHLGTRISNDSHILGEELISVLYPESAIQDAGKKRSSSALPRN